MLLNALLLFIFQSLWLVLFILSFASFREFLLKGKYGNLLGSIVFLVVSLFFGYLFFRMSGLDSSFLNQLFNF